MEYPFCLHPNPTRVENFFLALIMFVLKTLKIDHPYASSKFTCKN